MLDILKQLEIKAKFFIYCIFLRNPLVMYGLLVYLVSNIHLFLWLIAKIFFQR